MSDNFGLGNYNNLATQVASSARSDASGTNISNPLAGHNVEAQVKAAAITKGLDPEKVWQAAQTLDPDAQLKVIRGDMGALPNAVRSSKLADSKLVSYFVSAGVDKALAIKALKKANVGTQTDNPDAGLVAKVLFGFADPKNGSNSDDQAKIVKYLQSDSAKKSGVADAAGQLQPGATPGSPPTNTPGGIQNPANGGFQPSGGLGTGQVDDQYLAALRTQAKNFLSADQVRFLGSTASPNALLNAIGGPGGSDEGAAAMRNLRFATTGTNSQLPTEGDSTAAGTTVNMTPAQPNQFGAGDMVDSPFSLQPAAQAQSSIDKFANDFQQMAGGKTVTQALRLLPTMSQSELTALQRKLADSGYIAQVASGGSYEPDMWGDPTDPNTQAAWKQLLADSITTGTDVQTLLAQRTASFQPKLAQMQADKVQAEAAKAEAAAAHELAVAKQNQTTPDSTDNLMAAMRKLTQGGQLIGRDLNPQESAALAAHMQQLESAQQLAAQHGSSSVPQVDAAAGMQEQIIAEHPTEYLAQQTAGAVDVWKRLLSTPGAA